MKKKLIVIGGGAAGFFCAVNAAAQNAELEVIILEKSSKLLSKVRISGGGRCNVTHACFSIAEMIKKYPRGEKFLKLAFRHFFTTDTIDWFVLLVVVFRKLFNMIGLVILVILLKILFRPYLHLMFLSIQYPR